MVSNLINSKVTNLWHNNRTNQDCLLRNISHSPAWPDLLSDLNSRFRLDFWPTWSFLPRSNICIDDCKDNRVILHEYKLFVIATKSDWSVIIIVWEEQLMTWMRNITTNQIGLGLVGPVGAIGDLNTEYYHQSDWFGIIVGAIDDLNTEYYPFRLVWD